MPSFRFRMLIQGDMRTYPRSGFRSGGTSECTLVPVVVPGEHPPKPLLETHPFGNPRENPALLGKSASLIKLRGARTPHYLARLRVPQKEVGKTSLITSFPFRDSFGHFLVIFLMLLSLFCQTPFCQSLFCQTPFCQTPFAGLILRRVTAAPEH